MLERQRALSKLWVAWTKASGGNSMDRRLVWQEYSFLFREQLRVCWKSYSECQNGKDCRPSPQDKTQYRKQTRGSCSSWSWGGHWPQSPISSPLSPGCNPLGTSKKSQHPHHQPQASPYRWVCPPAHNVISVTHCQHSVNSVILSYFLTCYLDIQIHYLDL